MDTAISDGNSDLAPTRRGIRSKAGTGRRITPETTDLAFEVVLIGGGGIEDDNQRGVRRDEIPHTGKLPGSQDCCKRGDSLAEGDIDRITEGNVQPVIRHSMEDRITRAVPHRISPTARTSIASAANRARIASAIVNASAVSE